MSIDSSHRAGPTILLLAAAAVAVAVYLPTLGNGFVYDDAVDVTGNRLVLEGRYAEIFASPYHVGPDAARPTGAYRPLSVASQALNHGVAGLTPWPYHLANALLHAVATALVLGLGLALSLAPAEAALAALLFAVHPVHVEAVAAIANRPEPLAAVFYLGALLLYARAARAVTPREGAFPLAAAASLAFLGMLSKETAVTFVGAAAAWEVVVARRRQGAALRLTVAAAPAVLYLAIRAAVLGSLLLPAGSVTAIENPAVGQGLLVRLATAAAVFGRYASMVLWPVGLSPDYSYAATAPVRSAGDPWLLLGVAAAAALAVAAWRTRRSRPAVAFGLALAAIAYALVSNAAVLIGVLMADRLLYLPSAGLALAAAAAAAPAARRLPRVSAWATAGILLAALAAMTVSYGGAWRDDLSLWARAERAEPRSVKVLGSLAAELAARGRFAEAKARLDRAVAIAPEFVPNLLNLSAVQLSLGDPAAAESAARRALAIEPANAVALANLGLALEARGDREGAIDAYRKAVAARPDLASPLRRLEALGAAGAMDTTRR